MARLVIDPDGWPALLADQPEEKPERPWWIKTPKPSDTRDQVARPRRRLLRRSRTR